MWGGLTNWDEREVEIDLSRFAEGKYEASIFQDSVNANRLATDYQHIVREVESDEGMRISMKKGGGFAIHLKKQ